MEKLSGNIPAHAGKTAHHLAFDESLEEHPRARGENVSIHINGKQKTGTSPRTRGKHCRMRPDFGGAGNIPAHAGKTST